MPFADLPDVRLRYQFDGPSDASVVMCSNSLGTNLEIWRPQVAVLAKQYRVLRYDTRGHGKSATPMGPYSIDQLGHDVLGLLDYLNIRSVDFCGLSLGGMTGIWLAILHPERLQHLVVANTGAKIGTTEGWNTRIQTVSQQGMGAVAKAVLSRWFSSAFTDSSAIAETEKMLLGTDPTGYTGCCAAIRDMDQREGLKKIVNRTLVISGESDPVTTVADGETLSASIPGARHVCLPTAHLSNVEQPRAFTDALLTFLET